MVSIMIIAFKKSIIKIFDTIFLKVDHKEGVQVCKEECHLEQ